MFVLTGLIMNENPLRLTLSTRAIAGSEQAVHLIEQKERLEAAAMAKDAPLCLDMSKAFLESIFKTILSDRIEEPNLRQEFYPLFRNVKDEISFSDDQNASDLVGRLAGSIVNVVSELRNNFGAASHGDDGFHQNPIDMTSAEFVCLQLMVWRHWYIENTKIRLPRKRFRDLIIKILKSSTIGLTNRTRTTKLHLGVGRSFNIPPVKYCLTKISTHIEKC